MSTKLYWDIFYNSIKFFTFDIQNTIDMEKTAAQLLKELDEEREIILRYQALQKKRNGDFTLPKEEVINKPKDSLSHKDISIKRTGLKEAMKAFLESGSNKFAGRHEIANGIVGLFPEETIETILPKVSNVLSTDKDLVKPSFVVRPKPGSNRDKEWALKKEKGA